jgi:hypothetical protein
MPRAATRWSGMAPCRSARYTPALVRCASRCPGYGTAVAPAFAFTRRSCHPICAGRKASQRCCPGSPCKASRQGIFGKENRPRSWRRPPYGRVGSVWPCGSRVTPVVRKNHVTLLSLQVCSHDAGHPGLNGPSRAGAPEAGVGVLAAEQAGAESTAGCLAPTTYEDDRDYNAGPMRAADFAGGSR